MDLKKIAGALLRSLSLDEIVQKVNWGLNRFLYQCSEAQGDHTKLGRLIVMPRLT